MAYKLGKNAKLYVNATAFGGAPADMAAVTTKVGNAATKLLTRIRESSTSGQRDRTDITDRSTTGNKKYAIGLRDDTIEGTVNAHTDDEAISIILTAYKNGTAIAVIDVDQTSTTTVGAVVRAGDFYVSDLSDAKPLDGAVSYNLQLTPADDVFYGVVSS